MKVERDEELETLYWCLNHSSRQIQDRIEEIVGKDR